jgi:hypothetical protein
METLEGNKLIVEFMGGQVRHIPANGPYNGETFVERWHGEYIAPNRVTAIGGMKFHSSWDWLMPVIKKCYEASMVSVKLHKDTIHYKLGETPFYLDDIAPAWTAVVEFIQWYNENK